MKFFTVAALAATAVAYPGSHGGSKRDHSGVFRRIIERAGERLAERQGPPAQPVILIGDLQQAGTGGTATNDQIMGCFNSPNGAACLSTETYTPPTKDSEACAADTCCIWSYIKDDLVPLFREADGTCSDIARSAVRFGFHDAAAWNTAQTTGGADGSLLLSPDETNRPENAGLNVAKAALLPIYYKYKSYGISAADLVQFAHNVAVVVCPLGPRSLTYIGRPDWNPAEGEAPTGLLPSATADADTNLNLFADKTIGEVDLVALLGAHSTAKQFFFDTSKAGMPLDSTPGVWDVAFYSEVLNGSAPCGVFRLPSDDFLGADASTIGGFRAMSAGFPSDTGAGQILWNGLYAKAYLRLSLLGVAGIQGLTDCSKVLPPAISTFEQPPDAKVTCPASSSSSSSVIPSSTKSFSSFSFFPNTTSHNSHPTHPASNSHGGHPTHAGSTSKGGNGGKPTGSYGNGGYGDGGYGNGGYGDGGYGSGPKPTSSGSGGYGHGDGHWGYSTSTIYTTKTITITDKHGHPTETCVTEPVGTTTWPIEGPSKTTTITTTKTSTITMHGGKVTTSTWEEPITTTVWDDAWTWVSPTVTAAATKPATCKVKTVSITTTVWA
ncbi:uncharacterized protein PV09_01102 [Verruconis gallopava]|uniref:Peroxidase n=1 Tax=Verruconis gallopava TaxID=253628 RepID=A0A0D1XZD2_9PEZI|nr:uncharacterized protein PV09_01102 [Verruconis gallopava]KIW08171.1 hypothetical protein PV09_01102 [Verruconis gallopava]